MKFYNDQGEEIIPKSVRGIQWAEFAARVLNHIETYAVPQYGDYPNDQATHYTSEELFKQSEKYLGRRKTNQRPDQNVTDPYKSAHYTQMAATKRDEEDKLTHQVSVQND